MKQLTAGLLALLLLILQPSAVLADSLAIESWATGQSLNSVNLNSRMTTIQNWANGNLADDNIKASAAIQGSKLDLVTGTGRISNSTSVTSDAPVFTSTQTWNNAVTAFSGWRLNITNTNSASTSRLLDLQVDSTVIASISRVGQLVLNSQNYASGPRTLMDGAWLNVASATYTDNVTAASGTAPRFIAYAFQRPAVAAANTSVTTTDAATLFIASAPVAGNNMTLTSRWSLWVDQGNALFGGSVDVLGNPPAPRGYIASFTIANNGSDATNDIDVQPGVARDETNTRTIQLTSTLTKRLDEIFGIGNNGGCRDTGAIANTTYHVFAIASGPMFTPDIICSTSATSPTLPHTNWTSKRRIGSILRESAAVVPFVQTQDLFERKTLSVDVNVTAPGTDAVTRTLSVPSGLVVEAVVIFMLSQVANNVFGLLTPLDLTDESPTTGIAQVSTVTVSGQTDYAHWQGSVRTNTSRQIRSRISFSDVNSGLVVSTRGWIDRRGKDM